MFFLTCQLTMSDWTLVSSSGRQNFSTQNYCKFAVECDWKSKISQNVQNLGYFSEKKDRFFFEKKVEFYKITKNGIISCRMRVK